MSSLPAGWIAYTDDCCGDVTEVCVTPEEAIGEWLGDGLGQWRDDGSCPEPCDGDDDCPHYPEEILVSRVESPVVRFPARMADALLDDVSDINDERPESMEDWPPKLTKNEEASGKMQAAIEAAVLDYLKATTGTRLCPWWECVGKEQKWVRGDDGEWRCQ